MVKSEAKPGDRIRVFSKQVYEGTLMQGPDDEKDVLILKLDSGYNIGIEKKEIKEVEIVEKSGDLVEIEPIKLEKSKDKQNIAMIITGGTIAARLNPKKGGVDWLTSPEMLFKFYPDIFKIANVAKIEVPFMKASEDMDFKDWQKIAKTAIDFLNDSNIQGAVITHGTDFLHL